MMAKKFLFLSTRDSEGGASEWFYNLAKAMNDASFEVVLLVKEKKKADDFVFEYSIPQKKKKISKRILNRIKSLIGYSESQIITKPEYGFFPNENENSKVCNAKEIKDVINFTPDIIISGLVYGFVNTKTLLDLHITYNAPVFMTAFDVNVFTGGCHVFWGCKGFVTNCNNCPGIISKDKSSPVENLLLRNENIKSGNFGVMVVGPWSKKNAEESLLFRDSQKLEIGMCIDTEKYTDKNRDIAKRIFSLPQDSKVIFAGSDNINDERKGLKYFSLALDLLWEKLPQNKRDNIYILISGHNHKSNSYINNIKFKTKVIDFISDNRLLSLAYQASDIYVSPSLEDAGPMMLAEAISCGTPVVGFETGLLYDESYIINGLTGFRVEMKNIENLANAIINILNLSKIDYDKMSKSARELALSKLSIKHFITTLNQLSKL